MKWTSLKRFTKPAIATAKMSRPQNADHQIQVVFDSADGRPARNDIAQLNLSINTKRLSSSSSTSSSLPPSAQAAAAAPAGTSLILGPVADIHSLKLNTDDGWLITSSKLLLYYKFDLVDGMVEDIHSLELLQDSEDHVRLMASNAQQGRLFKLTPTEARLLAAYTYTDETISVVMSDSFVLTISDNGSFSEGLLQAERRDRRRA
jgi:hypothetical protein